MSGVASAVALLSLAVGSAAHLAIAAGGISLLTAGHPCPGPLVGTPTNGAGSTFSAVHLPVPETCAGRTVEVRVLAGTTQVAAGSTTVTTTGPTDVPVGGYTATGSLSVVAVVDGWALDVSWSHESVPAGLPATCTTTHPQATCEADVRLRPNPSWTTGYDLDITIRDTRGIGAAHRYAWTVEIDFSATGYPFVPRSANGSGVVRQSTCAQLPVLTVTGVTDWGNHDTLGRGETRTIWIQPRSGTGGSLFSCP